MEIPVLESKRLRLKPITLEDAPAIQKHFAHWSIIQHLSVEVPWPYPDDGALTYLRDQVLPGMAQGKRMCWGIWERDGSETIGLLEYFVGHDLDSHRGFWLAEDFHGRGYMTEAVTAFQDFIFFECGVERIFVLNAVKNAKSRKVKEKTAAEYVGPYEALHHNGESQCQRWVVTRENWARFRGRSLP